MKLIFILFLISFNGYSQKFDQIVLKNKTKILGKVLRVGKEEIEINPKGEKPFLIINRVDVLMILYSDNTIVNFKSFKAEDSTKDEDLEKGYIIDERDNKTYIIGKIGDDIWMLENLNYASTNSKCYKDNFKYCKKFGRLYNYNDAKKSCPNGWKLADKEHWDSLEKIVYKEYNNSVPNASGYSRIVGKSLKSEKRWSRGEVGGYNAFGFNALPSGQYGYLSRKKDYRFYGIGKTAVWYRSDGGLAMISNFGKFYNQNQYMATKEYYYSCRCIKIK